MRNSPEYIFMTDRGHAEIAHEGWQGLVEVACAATQVFYVFSGGNVT